jgi:hypothetical protein
MVESDGSFHLKKYKCLGCAAKNDLFWWYQPMKSQGWYQTYKSGFRWCQMHKICCPYLCIDIEEKLGKIHKEHTFKVYAVNSA